MSKALFKVYAIVFFVHLKLVKPGEAIENLILQQHPELKGLEISPRKVNAMLEKFGSRCLLILDGFDEQGLGQNEDVLRIIKNRKLIDCGIVVSSRPHSVDEVKQDFPTIVRVDGFTEKEASKFVSNFFKETNKISKILEFKPSDSREDFPVYKCPILLSILCVLVKERNINLSDRNLMIGDLYHQMIQCLYKKFTIIKGMPFQLGEFVNIMKSVGKLALQTLTTNKPLLQEKEVLAIAGDSAFEYGFFSGHENVTDPVSDFRITYVHRSIEEFFWSLGFIYTLDDGKSVDDILGSDCEKPMFMVNRLVLHFCLWLLTTKHFTFSKQIYDSLASYAAKRIDCCTLDTEIVRNVFPAMDIRNPHRDDNRLVLKFFKDVLEKCSSIGKLYVHDLTNKVFSQIDYVNAILGQLSPKILNKITVLSINELLTPDVNIDRSEFNLLVRSQSTKDSLDLLKRLLTNYNLTERSPLVYLTIDGDSLYREDLSLLMTKHIKQLRLYGLNKCALVASSEFPLCPLFTHFTADGFHIDRSIVSAFSKAVKDGKFPNLRRIDLKNCTTDDYEWPQGAEFSANRLSLPLCIENIICQLTELTFDCNGYGFLVCILSYRTLRFDSGSQCALETVLRGIYFLMIFYLVQNS